MPSQHVKMPHFFLFWVFYPKSEGLDSPSTIIPVKIDSSYGAFLSLSYFCILKCFEQLQVPQYGTS